MSNLVAAAPGADLPQGRRRALRVFTVETWYAGPRQAYMALERITCTRCGHYIAPGATFTKGGAAAATSLCYTCVPFWIEPKEARQWQARNRSH